jgi:hypothetical protein
VFRQSSDHFGRDRSQCGESQSLEGWRKIVDFAAFWDDWLVVRWCSALSDPFRAGAA